MLASATQAGCYPIMAPAPHAVWLLAAALGLGGALAAPSVQRLSINSQDPSWYGACPPPTASSSRSSPSPPCVDGEEVLGLPQTGLRFTWQIAAGTGAPRGITQTKYEAQVTDLRTGAVAWTSGVTAGGEPFAVASPQPPLASDSSYLASVRVWTSGASAGPTPWTTAKFDTAPDVASWSSSEWIGGHNQLRGDMVLPANAVIERARLYAIGLGAFVVSLNGQRVGDHVMDPPQTAYPSRALHASFNVTQLLKPGPNAIGALIGRYKYGYMDVWCNLTAAQHHPNACRSFRLQLIAELADGKVITAHTKADGSWVGRQSEIIYDHEYHGEIVNASLRLDGWDSAPVSSFPVGTWQPAAAAPPRVPDAALRPAQHPPVRVVETRKAVAITKFTGVLFPEQDTAVAGTTWVFDFGQNVAGFTELTATGPKGTAIYLRHGENLEAAPGPTTSVRNGYCGNSGQRPGSSADRMCAGSCGSFNRADASPVPVNFSKVWGGNCANQTNLFILAGTGSKETYRPEFTYMGFRYVQLYGWPAGAPDPTQDTLLQHFVHTDVARTGVVELAPVSGNTVGVPDLLNSIQHITLYAQLSNLWSIPTDCPQRERRGWMGGECVSHFPHSQSFSHTTLISPCGEQMPTCHLTRRC